MKEAEPLIEQDPEAKIVTKKNEIVNDVVDAEDTPEGNSPTVKGGPRYIPDHELRKARNEYDDINKRIEKEENARIDIGINQKIGEQKKARLKSFTNELAIINKQEEQEKERLESLAGWQWIKRRKVLQLIGDLHREKTELEHQVENLKAEVRNSIEVVAMQKGGLDRLQGRRKR